MIKFLKTTFDDSIKSWDFEKFEKVYSKNRDFMFALARYGKSIEQAYKEITGKDAARSVKEVKVQSKKD